VSYQGKKIELKKYLFLLYFDCLVFGCLTTSTKISNLHTKDAGYTTSITIISATPLVDDMRNISCGG